MDDRILVIAAAATGFHWLDYCVLVLYLFVLVGIGFFFAQRNRTTEDYFLAGRRIPWWAASLSIFSTHLSAVTFMAIPASAFKTDWTTILVNLGIILVAPLTVFLYLPLYRHLNVTSIYEYLEIRFGVGLRLYGSLSFVVLQLGKMGIFIVLPSIALSTVTGINIYVCIGVMGILCTVYTVLGGIEAVVWTDVLQSVVLLGGGLLCIGIVASAESFDFAQMMQLAKENNKFHIFNWEGGVTSNVFWVVIVGGFFIQMVPFTSDQTLMQRLLTTPSEKASANAIWAHAIAVVPVSLLFFGLGTALFVFYHSRPEAAPDMAQVDNVVPWFIASQLPAGLAGLVIAGLFAATMSTVDSSMHSIATALVTDFYRKFKPEAADEQCLKMARLITIVVGVLGTVSAVLVMNQNPASLWQLTLLFVGLFGSTMAGVFLLGVCTKRANSIGTAIGVMASMGTLIYVRRMPPDSRPFHGLLTAAVGVLVCFAVGYLASLVVPTRSK